MTQTTAFKTPEGEAAYLATYNALMNLWPVPYEEIEIPTQFGVTHIVTSGPKDASPLVLLHGQFATLTMWSPNVADFSKGYRIYAIDVMGQPGKSTPDPDEPIRDTADYVAWFNAILNGLNLDRINLIGASFGGWLALNFAVTLPERVRKLVLLSPAASFLPPVRQFLLRGMLMGLFPTHLTVDSTMGWLGFKALPGDSVARSVLDLIFLGLKHFRIPPETARIIPSVFSDDELRGLHVPVQLLIGDKEVMYDPTQALARSQALLPNFEGELVPHSSHDMCSSQYQIVNARVLEFLNNN